MAGLVCEDCKGAISGAQNLDHGAHLCNSGVVPHESRDGSGPLYGESGKREPDYESPSCEPVQLQLCPTPWGNAGSYSTANIADGSTVCLDTLSFTLI